MSSTDPLSGDDWADLAEELGVGEIQPVAQPLPEISATESYEEVEESLAESESDEDLDGEGEEGTDGEADGEDEGPRKRRRRRRRRKKKGGTEGATPSTEAGDSTEDDSETEGDSNEEQDDVEEEEAETQRGENLEDTSPEAARELIRTWNVPNWDEIIGGLYRPDR